MVLGHIFLLFLGVYNLLYKYPSSTYHIYIPSFSLEEPSGLLLLFNLYTYSELLMTNSISEVYREHPVHPHHTIPIDFGLVREVPDSHAWPPRTLKNYTPAVLNSFDDEQNVPVIDLSDPNVAKLVGYACQTWGMFQVTNHGVPMSLLEDVEGECWRLFSLPAHQKIKTLRAPDGITGYGLPRISPFFPKMMWHEGFSIFGSPLEHARQLWPHDDPLQFCDVMEEYQREMQKLSERLAAVLLNSLGITKEDLPWTIPSNENTFLQLNSYPTCPNPDRAMGLAAHTDTSLFTILHQSSTSGLQIFREGVGWATVPYQPGALIVNVGDLLHIISNGRFQSVLHRAIVNQERHRLSVAFFYGPSGNALISPCSKLVSSGNGPCYRSVTRSEYMGIKAKHMDKALSMIRL